ncbi:MAG: hypothetical protein M1358_25565 [Chloroflexi bacterium]|nr:hypothetical protein [Chloroflexota bacterium]
MYAVAEAPRINHVTNDPTNSDRNEEWLRTELDFVWDTYFNDVERLNHVDIRFGRAWKARLGMITLSASGHTTFIGVNTLLRSRLVPSFIPRVTIAHELVHYTHGFGSPLPKRHSHPHRGGVVAKELAQRGLDSEHRRYQQWLHEHWYSFYGRSRYALKLVRT